MALSHGSLGWMVAVTKSNDTGVDVPGPWAAIVVTPKSSAPAEPARSVSVPVPLAPVMVVPTYK